MPKLGWYLRIRIGCGTGSRPTKVPFCKNLSISLSSVKPLSMQIFSTCGTSTWSKRINVCNGNLDFQLDIHSLVAVQFLSKLIKKKKNLKQLFFDSSWK